MYFPYSTLNPERGALNAFAVSGIFKEEQHESTDC